MDAIAIVFGVLFAVLFVIVGHLYLKIPNKSFNKKVFFRWKRKSFSIAEFEAFIYQLSYSLHWLSKNNTGALIVVEKNDSLKKYIILGYEIKARLTSEFLTTIFWNKKSALHDGGLVIRNFDIVSVSSYFPVTQARMLTAFGARHRAAVGVTEATDAIAFVVSETTGAISYGKSGKLYEIEKKDLNILCERVCKILNFYRETN